MPVPHRVDCRLAIWWSGFLAFVVVVAVFVLIITHPHNLDGGHGTGSDHSRA